MPLISTRAGASARGFSHMASSILPGFNNNSALAVGHQNSPYVTVYKFNDVTGFGVKYADAATLLPDEAKGVAFASDGSVIAMASYEPLAGAQAYPWSSSTGFGTKYSAPSTTFSYGYGVTINPSKTAVVFTTSSSPNLHAYAWSSGFGTKYANPATLISSGISSDVIFNPAGNTVVTTSSDSPYIHAYAWSSGFGTKYANPATLIGAGGSDTKLSFNSAGDAVSMSNIVPAVYAWSSGFGTKYTNPGTLVSFTGGTAFNPAGNVIVFINSTNYTNILIAYAWNSSTGFGTKYADAKPNVATNSANNIAWNPTGTAVAFVDSFSPYIHVYSWYNGFQSKYTNPQTLPTGNSKAVAFI